MWEEKRGRYLVDHRPQLKTKDLAQFSQVGQAAGSEGVIRIPDSSQESMDQRVSVLEDQISCMEEAKEVDWVTEEVLGCEMGPATVHRGNSGHG